MVSADSCREATLKLLMMLCVTIVFMRVIRSSEASDVVVLTEANFTTFADSNDVFMFIFYVDWCTHCKDVMPDYELAARLLKNRERPIPLAKVDGMTQDRLAHAYEIKTYPKILIRNRNRVIPFEKRITTKNLILAMEKEADSAYKMVNNLNELEADRKIDEAVLLALTNSTWHPLLDLFDQSVRFSGTNLKAALCIDPAARKKYHVEDRDFSVILLRADRFSLGPSAIVDLTQAYTKAGATPKAVSEEIINQQVPIIGVYNEFTRPMYEANKEMISCIIPQPFSISREPSRAVNELAQKLKTNILPSIKNRIHWILVDELNYQKFVESYSDSEFTVGCKSGNQTYVMPSGKLEMQEVEIFARKTLLQIALSRKSKNPQ